MPHLSLPDAEIYYETHGEGSPFLFCSVTGLDHQAWKFHQVREFSRDHRVILFDYRGTGKSSKTVQKYSIPMFTGDAAALLDHLNVEQAIVCGHSMGGVVAQFLAIEHPRKVKKLILASSGAAHPGAHGIPLAMCRDMVRQGFEGYIREHTIETGWTKEFVAAHPELIEKFLQVQNVRHRAAGELSPFRSGAPGSRPYGAIERNSHTDTCSSGRRRKSRRGRSNPLGRRAPSGTGNFECETRRVTGRRPSLSSDESRRRS